MGWNGIKGGIAAAALALTACATTSIKDSWVDPTARAAPFRKVIVIAVDGDVTMQRIFEDVMAEKLRAVGVEGIQGYRYLPQGRATEDQMQAAVVQSGADGLMLVRSKGVRTETEVRTSMVPGGYGPGWYGWYGGWYGGWHAVPEVYQWRIATVETSIFDVATKRLAWTGVTETYDPTSFRKEAGRLGDIIVGALAANRLVPRAPA